KTRIIGARSHIILTRGDGPMADSGAILETAARSRGVAAASPFVETRVMIRSSRGASGAVLKGVDPDSAHRVIEYLNAGVLAEKENPVGPIAGARPRPGVILGKNLARSLAVMRGDAVHLISPAGMLSPIGHMPAMRRFIVRGIFASGMYEYDSVFAFIDIAEARVMQRMTSDAADGVEIRVNDVHEARAIAGRLVEKLGSSFQAKDWMEMNRNLFSALKLEKAVMFIILTLIVLVAAFNIAGALVMMVMQKKKDIAILKAMGAAEASIRKIFVFKGMVIGCIGVGLGGVLGASLCMLLKRYEFISIPGDFFYLTTLPVRLQLLDVVLIAAAALGICFLATLYPAHQAARQDPVKAIRHG
ncbi:MAG: ABC transporter permease, partial [Desulfobacterales bacterium]|nr:ABC transporter permease [Desulfobacterales bacterium]